MQLSKIKAFVNEVWPSSYLFTRPMTRYCKKNLKGNLVGVEIGVASGRNSYNILKNLDMKHLYLIDPFERYEDYRNQKKSSNLSVFEKKARKRLNFDNVTIIKDFSSKAIDSIPTNLDFVYIDGNHDYKFVKNDIKLYYPKVKKGGIIGGHDFNANFEGVARAVLEFIDETGHKLLGNETDWWCKIE